MKELQSLLSPVRKAIEGYSMIEAGDVVCVGVSGGKDSLAMLCALAAIRDFGILPFELNALMIDLGFSKTRISAASPNDHVLITELCSRLKVPLIVEQTEIASIVFEERKEKNPCSLCSNLRRGALMALTEKQRGNKLALGHHLQDAAETVMMKLLHEGRFGCFSPVTTLEDRNITVIRPMVLCDEKTIKAFQRKASLPVETSECPMDRTSERTKIREMLDSLDKSERGVNDRIVGALCRSNIDGWKEIK